MSIKLFQTERCWKYIKDEVFELINDAHSRGESQNGFLTSQLESELSRFFNKKFCITVASCTDALDISLQALQLPKDSPVAVGNYTFTASAHAIRRSGNNVVPVDVNNQYCIDVNLINNVSAVVAVDLFGNMCDYNALEKLNLPIIVDAAQSLESYNSKNIWSPEYGIASCISFSPSKTISSWGSGGAILTNDESFAERCYRLRLHGKKFNDNNSISPGLNSMMSSAECAAVITGLKYKDQWYQRRSQISQYLISESIHQSAIDLSIPHHSYSKLVFQSEKRSDIFKKFKELEIDTVIHYNKLIHEESLYSTTNNISNSICLRNISFTVPNQHTLTDLEVEKIAKALK